MHMSFFSTNAFSSSLIPGLFDATTGPDIFFIREVWSYLTAKLLASRRGIS